MKVVTPEISWHEREPIYSVDFQPGQHSIRRVASGGVDKIVRIWQFKLDDEGKGTVEFLSNLRRHTATVNIVRFSKNGELLATAGDDGTIILWKLSDVPTPPNIFSDDDAEEDKETWVCHKTLRGHLEDVADLSWSRDSRFLISGSVDNSAIVWDVIKEKKLAIFREHKSYVQGVAFDPKGDFVATMSSDRSMRIFNLNSKSCVNNVSKITLPNSQASLTPKDKSKDKDPTTPVAETKPRQFRIFHDDSLRSFVRRLEFSPDGQLLITPAGCMETSEGKVVNASFIFARGAFSKPALYLPSVEKVTTAIRVNPQLYQLRPSADTQRSTEENKTDDDATKKPLKEWEKHKTLFCLPYRVVYSVATEDSIIIYDSQQAMPIGLLKNIHYHQISDMSWSEDGKTLIVASTDGFCTIVTFEDGELGEIYQKPEVQEETPAKSKSSLSKETAPEPMDTGESPEKTSKPQLPFTNYTDADKKAEKPETSGGTNKTPEKVVENKDTTTTQESPEKKDEQKETSEKSETSDDIANNMKSVSMSDEKSPKIMNVEKKETDNKTATPASEKDAPKKKRIQFTTISLKSKN